MEQWKDVPGWFSEADVAAYRHVVSLLPANSRVVEVGSFLGKSAVSILPLCLEKSHQLFCVDKWTYTEKELCEHIAPGDYARLNWNDLLSHFASNVKEYKNYVTPIRLFSTEAAQVFLRLGITLDFVFIDAEHTYDSVKQDITAWLPLVKKGGYIGGHDYDLLSWPGVIQATNEVFTPAALSVGGAVWWTQV